MKMHLPTRIGNGLLSAAAVAVLVAWSASPALAQEHNSAAMCRPTARWGARSAQPSANDPADPAMGMMRRSKAHKQQLDRREKPAMCPGCAACMQGLRKLHAELDQLKAGFKKMGAVVKEENVPDLKAQLRRELNHFRAAMKKQCAVMAARISKATGKPGPKGAAMACCPMMAPPTPMSSFHRPPQPPGRPPMAPDAFQQPPMVPNAIGRPLPPRGPTSNSRQVLDGQIDHLNAAIENLRAAGMDDLANQLAHHRDQMLEQLHRAIADSPASLGTAIGELHQQIADLRAAVQQLRDRVEDLSHERR